MIIYFYYFNLWGAYLQVERIATINCMVTIQINFIALRVLGIIGAYNSLHLHVEHYCSKNQTTHSNTLYLMFHTSVELIKYIIYDLKVPLYYASSIEYILVMLHTV